MTVQENLGTPADTQEVVQLKMSDDEILERYSYPNPPPRPGSDAERLFSQAWARREVRNIPLNRKTSEKDLEKVLDGTIGVDAGERLKLALAIRVQLKKNKRRSRFMFWSGWMFFLSLLSGLGYLGYVYVMNNIHGERYTVPYTCKFQYGDSELEGHRFMSFPVKTLQGWRWTPPWSVVDEKVEIVLKGDPIIFVGVNDKGKTWRKEFGKGEFGTAILPNSQTYWVIGKNAKETTVIQHADFCK